MNSNKNPGTFLLMNKDGTFARDLVQFVNADGSLAPGGPLSAIIGDVSSVTGDNVSTAATTQSGAVTLAPATASAHTFVAGPTSGSPAALSRRAIVPGDLPIATTGALGVSKPDGTSVMIDVNGVLSVNTSGFVTSVNNASGAVTQDQVTGLSTTGIIKRTGPNTLASAVADTDYQAPISLTTTGSSGAATFISHTLNIPTPTAAGLGAVPTSTTVNGHALSSNVTVTTSDIGAVPTSTTVNGHALSANVTVTASDVGAVPTSTTVNGHALSSNVVVSASDLSTGTLAVANGGTGVGASDPVIQRVSSETGAVTTGTTQIPFDDTIPQNTEGDQYLSLSITPKNAGNILVIDVIMNLATSGSTIFMTAALFQDSTANALAASAICTSATASAPTQIRFRHTMTAGTTSSTTFKVRAGGGNTGTTTFNGVAGGRIFGGVMASSITILEIAS